MHRGNGANNLNHIIIIIEIVVNESHIHHHYPQLLNKASKLKQKPA